MLYSWLFFLILTSACATRAKHAVLEGDIFVLKKRMLDIEHGITATRQEQDSKSTAGNRKIAGVQGRLDAFENKLQKITGQLDALKVGVITGRYPGLSSEHESVASTLSKLQTRTAELSATQATLLKEFKALLALYDKKKHVKRSKKRKKITNLAGLKTAFERQRYRYVFEDAPTVIKRLRGKSTRFEAMYLLAESTFKLGKIRDAALYFNDLVEAGGDDEKYLRLAKLRLGDCFRFLGDKKTARLFYQDVVDAYAGSEEAHKATEKLQALGAG